MFMGGRENEKAKNTGPEGKWIDIQKMGYLGVGGEECRRVQHEGEDTK